MNNELTRKYDTKKLIFGIIGILTSIIFAYVLETPTGLENAAISVGSDGKAAMRILGVTMLSIVWWIGGVVPDWLTALIMLILFVLVGEVPFSEVFLSYNSTSVWLIIGAFCISAGVTKTGLFKRISYGLIRIFPSTYKGQVMALLVIGTICSPLIPSSTAKGVLGVSIASNIATAAGFGKDDNVRIGLVIASWFGFSLSAPAFKTGGIVGYTLLGLLSEQLQSNLSWMKWFIAMIPWLIIILMASYFMIPLVYKNHSGIKDKTAEKFNLNGIKKLEKMGTYEKLSAIILTLVVIFWVLESKLGISASITALIGAVLIFIFNILEPKEISTAVPWSLVIFLGAVLNIGNIFSKVGLNLWLQSLLSSFLVNFDNRYALFFVIFVSVILIRFVIVSQAATMVIMIAVLAPVIETMGISPFIIGIIVYTTGNCWFTSYQNVMFIPSIASTNNTVSFSKTLRGCLAYEIINLIACLACIPYWMFLGYI